MNYFDKPFLLTLSRKTLPPFFASFYFLSIILFLNDGTVSMYFWSFYKHIAVELRYTLLVVISFLYDRYSSFFNGPIPASFSFNVVFSIKNYNFYNKYM